MTTARNTGAAPSQRTPSRRIIGRYAICDEIAAGGMATVHLGRLIGPAGFSRTVAIKRLHPQYAKDPEFREMFLDEARLAAQIQHTNVVQTLDVVSVEGELFLVMEYVHGDSLSALLRRASKKGERMPVPIATAIVSGVLRGLHAAHSAKSEKGEPLHLVHRDVSPHNVLVGADGVARVLDFGVAKASGQSHATREGQVKGKLPYMAPEQLHAKTLGPWSDIWGASVVLWEVLTGKRLFYGETEAAILAKVLEEPIPSVSSIVPDIPSALDEVARLGLSRDPKKRFATAEDMANALERAERPALPSDVAAWLQESAADVLAPRAALIDAIARDSFDDEASPSTTDQPASPALSLPDVATVATTLQPHSETEPRTTVTEEKKPFFRSLRFAVAGVAVVAAAAFGVTHRGAIPPATPTPPAASSAALIEVVPGATVAPSTGPLAPPVEPSSSAAPAIAPRPSIGVRPPPKRVSPPNPKKPPQTPDRL